MIVTRFIGDKFSAVRYSRLTWPGEQRKPVIINIDAEDLKVYSSPPLKCGTICDDDRLVVLGNFFDDRGPKVVCGFPPNDFVGECISGCEAHEMIKPHLSGNYNVMCSHALMLDGQIIEPILNDQTN